MSLATLPVKEDTMIGQTDESPAGSYRLERFISVLMLDFGRLEAFRIDPEKSMAAAGLSGREQRLITEGTFKQICDHAYLSGPGPAPDPETDEED